MPDHSSPRRKPCTIAGTPLRIAERVPSAASDGERKARSPRSRTSSPDDEMDSTYSFSCARPRSMRRSRKGSGYTGGFGRVPCATSMSSAVQCRQDRNRPRSEAASWRVEEERRISDPLRWRRGWGGRAQRLGKEPRRQLLAADLQLGGDFCE